MSVLHDKSKELEAELRESEQFKAFETAFSTMLNNAEARKLYEDFRDYQIGLNQKQQQGGQITDEEVEHGRQQFELLKQNEIVNSFMEEEHKLNHLIHEISTIIMQPLEDAYEASMKSASDDTPKH